MICNTTLSTVDHRLTAKPKLTDFINHFCIDIPFKGFFSCCWLIFFRVNFHRPPFQAGLKKAKKKVSFFCVKIDKGIIIQLLSLTMKLGWTSNILKKL